MKLFGGRFGGVKIAVLSVFGAGVIGFAGYKIFFGRTGEAAVALIPADATCVVTLDTHPSTSQVNAFRTLSDALKREGLDKDMEDGVSSIIGKAGLAKDIKKYLTNNMASAWWTGAPGNQTAGVVLFSITNPGAVSQLISSGQPVNGAGVPAYSFSQSAVVAVVGDYLAVAQDANVIARIVEVQHGAPSMASRPEYQAARAALPADANLMVFASPESILQMMGPSRPKTTMWMSFGAALRDGGIQFDYRGPVDTKAFPGMARYSTVKPLSRDLLKKLPPDAYGLMAYSSLDVYFEGAKSGIEKTGNDAAFKKGEADFEKETGLSIDRDILPAFKGDTVIAIYPDAANSTSSADGILMIDNANGGDPAALADKVRAYLERRNTRSSDTNGPPIHFIQRQTGQVTIWSLDGPSAEALQKAAGGDTPAGDGANLPNPAFKDKNVSYAVCNGTLVVATSTAMMTKAMLTLNGGRSLADDPAFAEMDSRVNDKDQSMIMCSLSRVAARFSEEWMKNEKDSGITADDIVNLFGGPNTGLVGSGRIENDAATGSLFLPLDVDRMAKIFGSIKRQSSRPAMSAPDSSQPFTVR